MQWYFKAIAMYFKLRLVFYSLRGFKSKINHLFAGGGILHALARDWEYKLSKLRNNKVIKLWMRLNSNLYLIFLVSIARECPNKRNVSNILH